MKTADFPRTGAGKARRSATRLTDAVRWGPEGAWRRNLTWALGLIWLLDGALQFQPYMFTKTFPDQAIKPVGQGSPAWVNSPVVWSANLMADHIVFWNALFATIQVVIALGLFWRRTLKIALATSIVWAVMVWWLGEGLGGVLAGPQSPVAGLPGAVIVYALIAALLWPHPAPSERRDGVAAEGRSIAGSGALTWVGARLVWFLFWMLFVVESLLPTDRAPTALREAVIGMADGEPGWLASTNRGAAHVLGSHGLAFSITLATLFSVLAVSVLLPRAPARAILVIGVIASLVIWLVAEDLGEIGTGQATDPNSGPVLVLLMLCYWPRQSVRRPDQQSVKRSGRRAAATAIGKSTRIPRSGQAGRGNAPICARQRPGERSRLGWLVPMGEQIKAALAC